MRAVLLIVILGGCSTMSGMEGMEGMKGALQDAQHEGQRHSSESRAAPDLPSLVVEVDRHGGRMTTIFDDMRDHMSGMDHCNGMAMMTGMRDRMEAEMRDHQTTMHAMTDLSAARASDEHHLAVMNDMLGTMDMQLGGMHCGM